MNVRAASSNHVARSYLVLLVQPRRTPNAKILEGDDDKYPPPTPAQPAFDDNDRELDGDAVFELLYQDTI